MVNLRQQRYNERLTAQGLAPLKTLAVEGSRGKEGASWQIVENVVGKRQVCTMNVGVFLFCKSESENVFKDVEREKQEGIQGQWQQEQRNSETSKK